MKMNDIMGHPLNRPPPLTPFVCCRILRLYRVSMDFCSERKLCSFELDFFHSRTSATTILCTYVVTWGRMVGRKGFVREGCQRKSKPNFSCALNNLNPINVFANSTFLISLEPPAPPTQQSTVGAKGWLLLFSGFWIYLEIVAYNVVARFLWVLLEIFVRC